MTRQELITVALKGMSDKWHWFKYHFGYYVKGEEHFLARSIIDACLTLEAKIPGLGREFMDRMVSISGNEKHNPHYEQLLQLLAELMILNHVVGFDWAEPVKYTHEPTIGSSAKNPELNIQLADFILGIEVKTPQFIEHHNKRGTNPQQLPSRNSFFEVIDKSKTTLPRDNPIKDFLISANDKFASFKAHVPNYIGVLVIVGDDFIYEPISAILSPGSGLFTPNSFAKDRNGNVLTFPNVDCVILTRQLLQIVCATRDEFLPYSARHPLDYGRPEEFPFKALIHNRFTKPEIPEKVVACFQASEPSPYMGAEYIPSDFVIWT